MGYDDLDESADHAASNKPITVLDWWFPDKRLYVPDLFLKWKFTAKRDRVMRRWARSVMRSMDGMLLAVPDRTSMDEGGLISTDTTCLFFP